jgi:hypothetical protein
MTSCERSIKPFQFWNPQNNQLSIFEEMMMKRHITIALMFALLATAGIGSQQFSWAESPDQKDKSEWKTKPDSSLDSSSADAARRQEEAAKRAAEDAKRQAENVRRQTESIKRQAKELAKQQGMLMRQNPEGLEAQIHKAAEEFRDAEGDEAKAKAGENLRGVLEKYFEEDMKNRQEAVGDLEQRLQKLKAQLERRREKKQEIIDLQMKIAKNDAEGLGFYSEPAGAPFFFRFAPGVDADLLGPSTINVRVPAPVRAPEDALAPIAAPVPVLSQPR